MSSSKQIDLCFKYLNKKSKKKITLMHCISSYPTSLNKINMRSMLKMKSIYGVKYYNVQSLNSKDLIKLQIQ